MKHCIVLTTTSDLEEAKKIAHYLVQNKLAACANIVPKVISVYCWKEEICEDEEFLIFIKTRNTLFDAVKDDILRLHSYEVPEIIMLPLENGYYKYLDWLDKETKI